MCPLLLVLEIHLLVFMAGNHLFEARISVTVLSISVRSLFPEFNF